jgi:type II secretory pathway pseudopilin PulG
MRIKQTPSPRRFILAFTLVEMLVVIAIIVLLTGLIIGGVKMAKQKAIRSLVKTQLTALETAIDVYFERKGYYPPDNPLSSTNSQLFYELGGTYLSNGVYYPKGGQPSVPKAIVSPFFGRDGFQNSDANPNEVENFFKGGLNIKFNEVIYLPSQTTNILLLVPVDGPPYSYLNTQPPTTPINPWRYSISGTNLHNAGKYDLWADVLIGGKLQTIGNWKQD